MLCVQDEVTVMGFEVPRSPDSSYNNVYPGNEDEGREPPLFPPHLHQTVLNHPANRDQSASLPSPQNVVLNHLYIENSNRETPRTVVALGTTHRFRSKYVTVVLYKPVPRRGGSTWNSSIHHNVRILHLCCAIEESSGKIQRRFAAKRYLFQCCLLAGKM